MTTDQLFTALAPLVAETGLDLVDVEMKPGVLLVFVDQPGGVDLEGLTRANRVLSSYLDQHDPLPGPYALEVSSPGIERALRTPDHFTRAIGTTVSVKTRPQVPGPRRLVGVLVAADDGGFVVEVEDVPEAIRLGYGDVDKVRTVFRWGPQHPEGGPGGERGRAPVSPKKRQRKQVTTP
jgi:ribosome maturation factor RimP